MFMPGTSETDHGILILNPYCYSIWRHMDRDL